MNAEYIEGMRQRLIATYEPLIDNSRPVVLLDYPDAVNYGDHAIWLGEKKLLRHLNIEPAYQCSMEKYDRDAMARALGDGTILLHGGGNFGDLYKYHQFREQLLADFPDNPVIVFPQSVMFFSTTKLDRSVSSFGAHKNITITARDALSQFRLQKYFAPHTKVLHAPDMAFMLGRLKRAQQPRFDVLWLGRRDREAAVSTPADAIGKLGEPASTMLKMGPFGDSAIVYAEATTYGRSLCMTDWYKATFDAETDDGSFRAQDYDTKSRFWLTCALYTVALGKVVITDRVHGHILSLLSGIPHILLNNNYGKNFSYYETWSREAEGCWLAESPQHAWDQAQRILQHMDRGDYS